MADADEEAYKYLNTNHLCKKNRYKPLVYNFWLWFCRKNYRFKHY